MKKSASLAQLIPHYHNRAQDCDAAGSCTHIVFLGKPDYINSLLLRTCLYHLNWSLLNVLSEECRSYKRQVMINSLWVSNLNIFQSFNKTDTHKCWKITPTHHVQPFQGHATEAAVHLLFTEASPLVTWLGTDVFLWLSTLSHQL